MTTRSLAVYAAIVATASLFWSVAWTVYIQAFRDRPRIKQIVSIATPGDAVSIVILNRGRRPRLAAAGVRCKVFGILESRIECVILGLRPHAAMRQKHRISELVPLDVGVALAPVGASER